MAHTKGTFKDGHTGWKVTDFIAKYSSQVGYEVIYSDDGECVAEFVENEDDAKLIASAPQLLQLLTRIYNRGQVGPDILKEVKTAIDPLNP